MAAGVSKERGFCAWYDVIVLSEFSAGVAHSLFKFNGNSISFCVNSTASCPCLFLSIARACVHGEFASSLGMYLGCFPSLLAWLAGNVFVSLADVRECDKLFALPGADGLSSAELQDLLLSHLH